MYITLIAKRREAKNGSSWWVYSTLRNKTWYNVSFNKEIRLPQVYQIGKTAIYRAFIDLDTVDMFDIKDVNGHKTVYINDWKEVPDDQINRLKCEELCAIEVYRKRREEEKWSFLRGDDDIEIPF